MSNVFEIKHPILQAKVSQLRGQGLWSQEVKRLTSEVANILAVEVTGKELSAGEAGPTVSDTGFQFEGTKINERPVLVPVLRSGLAMESAFSDIFPESVNIPSYHLGVFRERATKSPIEYYNKLSQSKSFDVAFILDPIIATGGTACAVIESLKECPIKKIVLVSILASGPGIKRVSETHPDVHIYLAGIDEELGSDAYLIPG